MKTTIHTRELNANEKMLALMLSANIHGLIRDMDDLEGTTLFRQKIKATAKAFLHELEKHAMQQVWGQEIEGANISAAAEQMEGLAMMHRNLMQVVLAMSDMHESQQILFWQDMQTTFKRHKMPLQLSPTGDLKAIQL